MFYFWCLFRWHQEDQDFLENMEDFVTLDEVAEDEDEAHRESDAIGTWSQQSIITDMKQQLTLNVFNCKPT